MSNIDRSDFKLLQSQLAVNYLTDTNHSLYLGINGTAPWTDEAVPPAPLDTAAEQHEFWDHLVGFVKIPNNHVWQCIKNYKWLPNQTFETFDKSLPTRYQTRYYCVNRNFEVYICTNVTKISEDEYPLCQNEPIGQNSGNTIDTSDGYQWKFLYQVKHNEIAFRANDDWIPAYKDDVNSKLLNVHHIACRVDLTQVTGFGTSYRQLGLFVDIRNKVGNAIATADTLLPANVLSKSGYLVYTENIKKTNFDEHITDKLFIVIEQ